MLCVGCTRLNSAYSDTDGTPTTSANDDGPSPGTTASSGSVEEAEASASTTGHETPPPATDTGIGETDGPAACLDIFADCDAFEVDTCPEGQRCRPWSDGIRRGVGCVATPRLTQPLAVGDACAHLCGPGYGVDECPPRSICDPTAEAPTCVPLCGPGASCLQGICEESEG